MGPEKKLLLRSKCCNVAMVKSCGEMVPVRERLGREREMTELPVGVHCTPIQLQGVESVGTQDESEGGDSSPFLKARRAVMSGVKADVVEISRRRRRNGRRMGGAMAWDCSKRRFKNLGRVLAIDGGGSSCSEAKVSKISCTDKGRLRQMPALALVVTSHPPNPPGIEAS
jgi:hypothetical protein